MSYTELKCPCGCNCYVKMVDGKPKWFKPAKKKKPTETEVTETETKPKGLFE